MSMDIIYYILLTSTSCPFEVLSIMGYFKIVMLHLNKQEQL